MNFLKRSWKLLAGLVLVFLILGLAASWLEGGRLSAPANRPVAKPSDLPVRDMAFTSGSSSLIHAWTLPPATNRGVVILQHGVRGNRESMLSRARFLHQAGYGVLMFDFQAHGESKGSAITMGYLESLDSLSAVSVARSLFPHKPVAIIGESLGAAAAVLSAHPLDVNAMVLELMYPTIVDATKDRLEMRLGGLGRCLSPLLTAQIGLRLNCTADDLRPIEHVADITCPKLFLAGTADRDTKLSESKEIFARAAEPKTFVSFEGAGHQDLHNFDKDRYEKLILEFLDKNMK